MNRSKISLNILAFSVLCQVKLIINPYLIMHLSQLFRKHRYFYLKKNQLHSILHISSVFVIINMTID